MKKLFVKTSILLCVLLISVGPVTGDNIEKHHSKADIYCSECHSCDKPGAEDPCLKCCPEYTRKGVTVYTDPKLAPDELELDLLISQYKAAVFPHRAHAEMALMGGGCVSCHHYNPPGKVEACRNCHEKERKRDNLHKPDLKAAYHRQCLGCHREWQAQVECYGCHLPIEISLDTSANNIAVTKVNKPDKLIYKTDFDEGKIVTFYHNNHSEMFGLQCNYCHNNESCANCHGQNIKKKDDQEDSHAKCVKCHQNSVEENCGKCHDDREREPFDHASTGWALEKYHQKLNCSVCHGNGGKFYKPQTACKTCHNNFDPEYFNHSVTGFVLDENHVGQDCELCHRENRFTAKPQCNECHDDYSYPEQKPGAPLSK